MKGLGYKITELYAFVADHDGNGDEGIISIEIGGIAMPLIGADKTRVELLRHYAKQATAMDGTKAVKLVKFSHREELETL